MSGGPRPRRVLLGYLAVEILAVTLGVCIAALLPFKALDERWLEFALQRAGSSSAPERLVVIDVSPGHSKLSSCGRSIASTLTRGGARAGLMLSPLSDLCDGAFDSGALDSELAPPIEPLPAEVFRRAASGRIVGIAPVVERSPLLTALGVKAFPWVAGRTTDSVPVLRMDDLMSGDASPALLSERIAVLSLGRESTQSGIDARNVAGVLEAALQDGPRPAPARWLVALIALVSSLGVAIIHRRSGAQRQRRLSLAFAGGVFLALSATDLLGMGLLLPLPSLLASFATSYVVLLLPRRAAVARADRDAQQLLKDAGRLLSLQAPGAQDDGEFWRRLARTVAQTHAADDVLIAELPPFSWRLKIWSNGATDESIIKERRRDIRRTPYANLQGVPVASVVHDYLVMKGVPAVLIPLIAANEVEGYMILIGKSAVDEFTERPELGASLADDLAQMVREARLARVKNEAWRGGGMRDLPLDEDLGVLERARVAMAELRLLRALVQDAPVGVFYADSFGDVRILGRRVLSWLPEFDIDVPAARDGSLDPGVLTLKQLLGALARKTQITPPALTEIDADGYELDVPMPPRPGQRVKALNLKIVPLRRGSSQDPTGFVGSLTESAILTASMAPRPSIMQQTVSSLQVFSLSKLVTRIVSDLAHRTGGKVQLQTPRDEAHIVAHRADLQQALEAFLLEAARHSASKGGPVLALRQKRLRVELQIMDLRLDAPQPALERALLAPSNPPPGLAQLGELIRAVENSHGEVKLSAEESFGTVLSASFVRARPRVQPSQEVPELRLYNKPVQIG